MYSQVNTTIYRDDIGRKLWREWQRGDGLDISNERNRLRRRADRRSQEYKTVSSSCVRIKHAIDTCRPIDRTDSCWHKVVIGVALIKIGSRG